MGTRRLIGGLSGLFLALAGSRTLLPLAAGRSLGGVLAVELIAEWKIHHHLVPPSANRIKYSVSVVIIGVPMGEGIVEIKEILIVDDNPRDIRFIEDTFHVSELDPTIHTATTSDEAINLLTQRQEDEEKPTLDVILLDWSLSKTTGKEVLQVAKSTGTNVPVVVMTGSLAETDELTSIASKADLVIEKPTDPDEYIKSVHSVFAEQ